MMMTTVRSGSVGQAAAANALIAFPPPIASFNAGAAQSPAMIRLLAALGDLRAIDAVRAVARAHDPAVRAAGLVALGEMGDTRSIEAARAGLAEPDPGVRSAAAEALVLLGAPDRLRAVESLLGDEETALAATRLAERGSDDGVVKALAARAVGSADPAVRAAAIAALGRSTSALAVRALSELVKDPAARGDAADALARSPSGEAMPQIESMAAIPSMRRLAVRAYIVRAIVRGERSGRMGHTLESMADGDEPNDRALGGFGLVALGARSLTRVLADRDARVRRAAAMASLAQGDADSRATLLARREREEDPVTRTVLGIGLLDGDSLDQMTTLALVDRAESGDPDAPLAALAIARRFDATFEAKISALLAARDPTMRAHVARGLGASGAHDAAGRLSAAYAYEPDASVRRAIILALAALPASSGDRSLPARRTTLKLASRLDPDSAARWSASRALAGLLEPLRVPATTEIAWLRLMSPDGSLPPAGLTATLIRSDGLAIPIAFDDDGYALVPVPPGLSRLALAPRVPPYEASMP
jgi:hypothetical protein